MAQAGDVLDCSAPFAGRPRLWLRPSGLPIRFGVHDAEIAEPAAQYRRYDADLQSAQLQEEGETRSRMDERIEQVERRAWPRTAGQFAAARPVRQDGAMERERRFYEILEALPAAIYTTDAAGRISFYNRAAVELAGRRPDIGRDRWCISWRLYTSDGKPLPHDRCPLAQALATDRQILAAELVIERPDGVKIPVLAYPTPLHAPDGARIGAVNMLVDISDRKRAEERQKALIAELNHRVMNTLATVQALSAQTLQRNGPLKPVQAAFEARLLALSTAHALLAQERWEAANLQMLLERVLSLTQTGLKGGGGEIRLSGAPVSLPPRATLALAMVFHELADNAAQFGALRRVGGVLAISWRVTNRGGARSLKLDWAETSESPIAPAQEHGFGLKLVERSIIQELKGCVSLDFGTAGLHCTIDIPLIYTTDEA
jgi:PAS domain S-box-containing protein